MKKFAILLIGTLLFVGNQVFAQEVKKTEAEYKAMITFEFKGKTWVYSHQEDKEGNVLKNGYFLKGQQFVLKYKKENPYQVVTTEEKNKTKFKLSASDDADFHLRYYMLSCGFLDLYAPLSKEKKNTLYFQERNSTLVFIAKK